MNYNFEELANGKSSSECIHDEAVNAYLKSKKENETLEERIARIRAFRCGW